MLLFENLVPVSRTDAILKRLLKLHPKLIDLKLDRELRLLERIGNPQDHLPPVIHVAGTNGKGSTLAYLRAFLEASGKKVHVMTSPHLVRFNERIRLAGKLVSSRKLNQALEFCEQANGGEPITFFEITTAAALKLFSEVKADYLLLETGMGGRFDASNVVAKPLGTVITPVDYDHQNFLGNSLDKIAWEKAGILKRGAKAVFGRQRDEGRAVLVREAARLGVTPLIAGEDFDGRAEDGRLVYQDEQGLLDLPPPALAGPHQFDNAALAIAAARHFGLPVSEADIAKGLREVNWPARLQPVTGTLLQFLPPGSELWLDGGHNAHGAAALALALGEMQARRPLPLVLIMGLMNTRKPADFLAPFAGMIEKVFALSIPGEPNAHPAATIVEQAREGGFDAVESSSILNALADAAKLGHPARVVFAGSLYLAGHVLHQNGTPPT
ncbi:MULTISPECIES: folylpolyglutamate synthase/dihydrofolate synthase family protein [unclassified Devosia]|mgnify:FL=1|uniref:bifunctional folylpolyglutamate synthase/dihydrofolate synthase n=1 Tax=unclassified Devosia TaxID=196773 RepID=UPI00086F232A|nr:MULTISPECIES: folylpolyglutamate synthase/dihydrofolate synthase family protein [unclassified Devosia]ODS92394.1 MAG: bifunctional folylpolyglutamate synthase/dihydrofolate synthase [Devosia sp. SCN 66-27]OJX23916.1 MAG: bifunctional folylpolyglutamate synthase/dihydrofolate synthase [Devosia sp. 66-14]